MLLNPYRFATGAPGGPDPFFSLVKYGANFTGANNSTAATDFSSSARPITFVADAKISTAQSTFGAGSSLLLDGTGDYIHMPDSADWAPGASTDWCWEFVIRPNGNSASAAYLLSQAVNNGFFPVRIFRASGANGGLGVGIYSSTTTLLANITSGSIPDNAWAHIAVCVESGNLRLKINGAHVSSTSIGTAALYNAADTMKIGSYYPSGGTPGFNGNIQCARYTLGNARYTGIGSYTQPSELFPTS